MEDLVSDLVSDPEPSAIVHNCLVFERVGVVDQSSMIKTCIYCIVVFVVVKLWRY